MRYFDSIIGLIKIFSYKLFSPFGLKFNPIIRFSRTAQISIRKTGKMIFSKRVSVNKNASLAVTAKAKLLVGEGTGFGNNTIIVARERIEIGSNVMIGPNVCIYDHDHVYKTTNIMKNAGFESAPVIIQDNVWIGAGVIILKGVTISSGSVIAAGTIVSKDVPSNSIVFAKQNYVIKEKSI
jgi:acetyltransferase-like isoleucine patch superfamily enzyme